MKVSEVMTSPAATCRPSTSLAAAALEMLRHDCGMLPVVEEGRGLVGVVTDRDICIAVGTRHESPQEITVETVMTTTLQTVSPEASLEEALELMGSARLRRLPVVDEHWMLYGVISVGDIVCAPVEEEQRADAPSLETIMTAMRGICAHWRPRQLVHTINR